jgi:hypothetical protein
MSDKEIGGIASEGLGDAEKRRSGNIVDVTYPRETLSAHDQLIGSRNWPFRPNGPSQP